ncbi:hypothetical protein [Yoonia sp. 208BN28-4]|uniref:hypothetical protein n=1 Tax=Yoonia sp. 208BN28-4 TaxID=3126505 RepID=UPI0030A8A4A0
MKNVVMGLIVGCLIGGIATALVIKSRVHWLAALEFETDRPDVPFSVLEIIQDAERQSYAQRSFFRRGVEEMQDAIVFLSPEIGYRTNFSLGRYRIKAATLETILPWAIEQGYLTLNDTTQTEFAHALAYFSEQPGLNDWQASVYLEWLRRDHPMLVDLTWPDIAADPLLIAKLYSGYMGAGGAWEQWRADLTPGPVALRRLGLADNGN